MALIKCRECGKEISDQAAACPNCGCPNVPVQTVQAQQAPQYRQQNQYIQQPYTQPVPPNNQQYVPRPYVVQPAYKKAKKSHSTLSCVACAFAGVAMIFPLIKILGFFLAFVGMILGIIDLCIYDKNKRHLGSWFSLVVFFIYIIIMLV